MKLLKNITAGFFSLLYPRHCLICNTVLEDQKSYLCKNCWFNLPVIGASQCKKCGAPLGQFAMPSKNCEYCKNTLQGVKRVVAVLYYTIEAREMILKLKFQKQMVNAYCLGELLASHLKTEEFIQKIDVVTAVPLHWKREFSRTYNQADLIAGTVARELKIEYQPKILSRRKQTSEQAILPFEKRKSNVADAFKLNYFKRRKVKSKRILLIDDVMTTGSTLSECALTLKREGAKEVYGAVVARAGLKNIAKIHAEA